MLPVDATLADLLKEPERKPRLLVVDDQPTNIQVLYRVFADDCQVFMATSGEQALHTAREEAPDVILLDDFGDKSRTNAESDDRRRIIYQLINYRHNNGLPMLITSNLTAAEMSMQFGQRTVERIIESCAWVKVGGDNLRLF